MIDRQAGEMKEGIQYINLSPSILISPYKLSGSLALWRCRRVKVEQDDDNPAVDNANVLRNGLR